MATKSEPATKAQHYLYSVGWSEPDRAFVARVAEFPSLSAHGDSMEAALQEIRFVVEAVIEDLEQSGERIPEPIGSRKYPTLDVEIEGRCSITVADELLIQKGMMATGKTRQAVITQALSEGLQISEAGGWLDREEEEKRKRA